MRRVAAVVVLVAMGAAGVAAGVFTGSGAASPKTAKAPAVTTKVTVAASEFKFKLSKARVPVGTVIFTVVNKGKISHDFKIAGKKTKSLLPGQKATLTVKFGKKGRFGYICSLPGHAGAGMNGTLSVGVTPPKTTTSTSTSNTTTTTTTTSTTATTVTGPATTINVGMFEYRFDLSQTTIPSGQVTFVITNNGAAVHNFAINGVKSGALLAPGKSETWTVGLPPNMYAYICDVPFHAERGMTGSFTVTPS
ncbi:MAG: cupredoxin domain-containing protein [Thermoleophilia bacterium]